MQAMQLQTQASIDCAPLVQKELPVPEPGPGEVRVKISVCAVCRTDLHIIEGDLPLHKTPIIPGHQIVGTVDELGENCERLRLGQRVGIAWLRHTDGTCRFCQRGQENLCIDSRYTGYHADGGFAEYALVPEDFAYQLPDHFDDVHVSPLLCAGLIGYRALQRAAVPAGGRLLLVGFGSSAHIVMPLALHRGYEVYVLTRTESHQCLAEEMGATWTGSDPARLPMHMDSAILFAPVGRLVPPVLERLDKGGTLAIAGIHLSDVPALNYRKHLFHEKQVRSVEANTRADAHELLREAEVANVQPRVRIYALYDANVALADLKHSRVDGTGVLMVAPHGA